MIYDGIKLIVWLTKYQSITQAWKYIVLLPILPFKGLVKIEIH